MNWNITAQSVQPSYCRSRNRKRENSSEIWTLCRDPNTSTFLYMWYRRNERINWSPYVLSGSSSICTENDLISLDLKMPRQQVHWPEFSSKWMSRLRSFPLSVFINGPKRFKIHVDRSQSSIETFFGIKLEKRHFAAIIRYMAVWSQQTKKPKRRCVHEKRFFFACLFECSPPCPLPYKPMLKLWFGEIGYLYLFLSSTNGKTLAI